MGLAAPVIYVQVLRGFSITVFSLAMAGMWVAKHQKLDTKPARSRVHLHHLVVGPSFKREVNGNMYVLHMHSHAYRVSRSFAGVSHRLVSFRLVYST